MLLRSTALFSLLLVPATQNGYLTPEILCSTEGRAAFQPAGVVPYVDVTLPDQSHALKLPAGSAVSLPIASQGSTTIEFDLWLESAGAEFFADPDRGDGHGFNSLLSCDDTGELRFFGVGTGLFLTGSTDVVHVDLLVNCNAMGDLELAQANLTLPFSGQFCSYQLPHALPTDPNLIIACPPTSSSGVLLQNIFVGD